MSETVTEAVLSNERPERIGYGDGHDQAARRRLAYIDENPEAELAAEEVAEAAAVEAS